MGEQDCFSKRRSDLQVEVRSFTKKYHIFHYVLIFFIISIGLFLRWYGISERPLHHDESLHGMYSFYYFQNALTGFYKYDPLLHGPLLYHTIPWSYWLFGVTKWSLRAPAAVLGSSLIFFPFLWRRYLTPNLLILFIAFISLSPTLTYWSRFIRHDGFVLFSLAGFLASFLISKPSTRLILCSFFLALHFSAKENFYVHLAIAIGFLIYEYFSLKLLKLKKKAIIERLRDHIVQFKFSWFVSISLFFFIICWYYSAGFIYPDGISDALYKKGFSYWLTQHSEERISGPFIYNFLVNMLYESWWAPFLILHLLTFYKENSNKVRCIFLTSFLFPFFAYFISLDHEFFDQVLKLKIPSDYLLFFPLVTHSILTTTTYLKRGQNKMAISAYAFFATLFTYCYLGEKVPWLAVYPLITGIIFYIFHLESSKFKRFIYSISPILLLFNCYSSFKLNIEESGYSHHLISQVQTTREYEQRVSELSRELQTGRTLRAFNGQHWPLTWYLYGRQGYFFYETQRKLETFDFIISSPVEPLIPKDITKNFEKEVFSFRVWWLPDYKELSINNLFKYYLFKIPWNKPGTMNLWFYKNKKITLPLDNN